MDKLIDKIISIIPTKWRLPGTIMAIIFGFSCLIYAQYSAEVEYHTRMFNRDNHTWSKIKYDGKMMSVNYERLPVTAECSFKSHLLIPRPYLEDIRVFYFESVYDKAAPYRTSINDTRTKEWPPDKYGLIFDIGKYIKTPGTYDIYVQYKYTDCVLWGFGYTEWIAEEPLRLNITKDDLMKNKERIITNNKGR